LAAQHIGAADAFIVVTPEYNHGYPAALNRLSIPSAPNGTPNPSPSCPTAESPEEFAPLNSFARSLRKFTPLRFVIP